MRFIAAFVSFVIAFSMIAYGIAQRTILNGPDSVSVSAVVKSDAAVTVIDGKVLHAMSGRQQVEISGADSIFAAYGRSRDVQAWIGDASYNKIGVNASKTKLTSRLMTGSDAEVPDPHGSDLWLGEYTHDNNLTFTVNVPTGISVIVVSNRVNQVPGRLSISWPVDNRTPWSGPLIAGGVLLLVIGLGLYLWALASLRKARGPRRKPPKSPKMPKLPKRRIYKPRQPEALVADRGRRSVRRMVAVVPILLVGTLALSGCSRDLWPEALGGSPETTPTAISNPAKAAPPPPPAAPPPAVSVSQLKSIVARVSVIAAKADAAKDGTLAATRFAGPALKLREANYAIRTADDTFPTPAPIPSQPIVLTLPQQSDSWPRTVFTVIGNPGDPKVVPTALMLIQQTPRDNYKVQYAVTLESKAVLPDVAPADVGAARLPADIKLLTLRPDELTAAFGDILAKGPESTYTNRFDLKDDSLIKEIGLDARNARKAKLQASASMTFENAVGDGENVALATNDSGAIVAVSLNEIVVVKPVAAGASVNAEGAVKSLSTVTSTTKGTSATYADLLLFFVPAANSNGKIVLLGWASGLIAAKELP